MATIALARSDLALKYTTAGKNARAVHLPVSFAAKATCPCKGDSSYSCGGQKACYCCFEGPVCANKENYIACIHGSQRRDKGLKMIQGVPAEVSTCTCTEAASGLCQHGSL